jgi:hypothetical protein
MQGDVHRGSKITGSALSTRKLLHNQNSYRYQNDSVAPERGHAKSPARLLGLRYLLTPHVVA